MDLFAPLEPVADGFRNYTKGALSVPAEALLVDRALLLTLTAPGMTVLVGGLRALLASQGDHGAFVEKPGTLTSDFFVRLLDMAAVWTPKKDDPNLFECHDRATKSAKWTDTRVDLVFGSNSELRAIAEVYDSRDGAKRFIPDFVAAWTKVMHLDRYDLR